MKLISRIGQTLAGSVLLGSMILGSGVAFAAGPGQIEGGNSNYTIEDVTRNSGFANTQTAQACDTVEYRLNLYNPGPSAISDVKVEATINDITPYTSFISDATVFTPSGLTKQVNFQATLNMTTAQTQTYVAHSTELLNTAGKVINSSGAGGTLSDTITDGAGGIDIGGIGYSVNEYVEFQAKLSCPTPPPPVPATCNLLTLDNQSNQTTVESVNYTLNDAKLTGIDINYGDGTVTTVQPTNFPLAAHTYANPGTFNITATLDTSLGNVTSNSCAGSLTWSKPTTPVTPPPTTTPPTQLVNTGPGSTVAVFAGATVFGAALYNWILRRRAAKN